LTPPHFSHHGANVGSYFDDSAIQPLREGELHFGFVRTEDAARYPGIELSRGFDVSAFAILAGNSAAAPCAPVDFLRWLVCQKRPLVQHGSTWMHTRTAVA
jgi:hypothetical protein